MAGIRRSATAILRVITARSNSICPGGGAGIRRSATALLRVITARSNSTCAAAAAHPHLDHDYFNYQYRVAPAPVLDPEMSPPARGVQWVLIGPTSRHVYARKLSDLLQVPHISMASLLRQDLNPTSSLYKQIAHAVNKGELVPEDIIFGLLSKRLEDGYYEGETGFILDGFPRTKKQAEILDKLVEVDLVVNFKGAKDCLLEHHKDGFFSNFATPDEQKLHKQSKFPVLNSGSAWKGKTQSYAMQVMLLEDYYKKQKKLIDFQVCNAPGETWQGLLVALQLQHIDDTHCGPRLP